MIQEILSYIHNDWTRFQEFFKSETQNDHKVLKFITRYLYHRSGKQLRPLLVILSAKINGGVTEKTLVGASLVEMLHSASLMHDDVIDNADLRRGFFSIKALWGAKGAVLAGDYFLAKGLSVSLQYNAVDLLRETSHAVEQMSQGELLQMRKSRHLDYQMQNYLEIIEKKTASLFSACGAMGALSAGTSTENVERMRLFGKNMGMAFQIKDDVLDFTDSKLFGKKKGNDIVEQKITLPLILALGEASTLEKQVILKSVVDAKKSTKSLQKVIDFTISKGGIEKSAAIIDQYINSAKQVLDSYNDDDIKQNLKLLINFFQLRTH